MGSRAIRRAVAAERGSATVWVLALVAVVWTLSMAMFCVGQVLGARHRAAAAADLSALAAAEQALWGRDRACGAAVEVATAQGARLSGCAVTGLVADVAVEVPLRGLLGHFPPASARARAGP